MGPKPSFGSRPRRGIRSAATGRVLRVVAWPWLDRRLTRFESAGARQIHHLLITNTTEKPAMTSRGPHA